MTGRAACDFDGVQNRQGVSLAPGSCVVAANLMSADATAVLAQGTASLIVR